MPSELLARALEQVYRCPLPERATALLRVARVMSAFDRDKARQIFKDGFTETEKITGRYCHVFLEQASHLAAAVDPELLSILPARSDAFRPFASQTIGRIMLEHGHHREVFEFLTRYPEPSTYPYQVASATMLQTTDVDSRHAIFLAALEAWRAQPSAHFIWLFQTHWTEVPTDEAQRVVREIVRVALDSPDHPVKATYDIDGTMRISSSRENSLFQLLHVLRKLDPLLAETLIAQHRQLAIAAQSFPNGMDSVREAAENRRKASGSEGRGGYGVAGSPDDFPFFLSLMQASDDGDFGPPMEHALTRYKQDVEVGNTNEAPREFWPSTSAFCSILYRAGKRLGHPANAYLDLVPDPHLKLFAEIELASALSGLPEFNSIRMEFRPRPRDTAHFRVERRAKIHCPKCNWSPGPEDRWSCTCGHLWNTFKTRGVCPACKHQWSSTECLACKEWSPHAGWYAPG